MSKKKVIDKTNPLSIGIRTVGVGLKGSRPLSKELCHDIYDEIVINTNANNKHIQIAAFLGAFLLRKRNDDENAFLESLNNTWNNNIPKNTSTPLSIFQAFIEKYCPHISTKLISILKKLLQGNPLVTNDIQYIAQYLFIKHDHDTIHNLFSKESKLSLESTSLEIEAFKAFFMANIRYRYTDKNEYTSLYNALMMQIQGQHPDIFKSPNNAFNPITIISEPFDGLSKNYFVTPFLAYFLKYHTETSFLSLQLVGKSSGPKFDLNLLDIALSMEKLQLSTRISPNSTPSSHSTITQNFSTYDQNFIHTNLLLPTLDDWQKIRSYTLKRPFLATLEKFPRLYNATYFISSAFHDNYSDIMLSIAEHTGYSYIIIVRKGREGSIGFSLSKPVELHLSYRLKNNKYARHTLEYSLGELGLPLESDGREELSCEININYLMKLIGNFSELDLSNVKELLTYYTKQKEIEQDSTYLKFMLRAILTSQGIVKAIQYLKAQNKQI